MLACRAGAKRVYAIEEGGMIEVARSLCEANGFTDRMRFIKGLSTQVTLPEPVDLVVADQIGHFGFEAGICEYFRDARARFLKPHGRMIPGRIDLHVAPVEHQALRNQHNLSGKDVAVAGFSRQRPHFKPATAQRLHE